MFVITADQVRSVRTGDRVPAALEALTALGGSAGGVVRAFERTVGDEIQAVVSSAETVVDVVTTLTREGGWRIGIGIGPVDRPLPRSTRAATGPAFLLAREAITAARGASAQLAVCSAADGRTKAAATDMDGRSKAAATDIRGRSSTSDTAVGGHNYASGDALDRPGELAEGVLWLLIATLRRRTNEGWIVVSAIESTGSGKAAAARLKISPSAVSQRLNRAAWPEARRGATAAAALLTVADRESAEGGPR